MKKRSALLITAVALTFAAATGVIAGEASTEAAVEGMMSTEAATEIDTAEELAAMAENLAGSYVLTADIDLGGAEWTPIGTFHPAGESEEEQEVPDETSAFSGTFDGNGHTISNFTIDQPEGMILGLFGCVANGDVGDLKVEKVKVDGSTMAAAVIGYAYSTQVHDIAVSDVTVTAHASENSSEGMYGGIVGAGMNSTMTSCSGSADIFLSDSMANAGILAGGMEQVSFSDCQATGGSLTAGDNCYGLGGISGCGFGSKEFTDCKAENITITAGKDTKWVGGITGYAGGYEDESFGLPVTVFTGCETANMVYALGEGSGTEGEIVGAGFYSAEAAEAYGAPYDNPSEYVIK